MTGPAAEGRGAASPARPAASGVKGGKSARKRRRAAQPSRALLFLSICFIGSALLRLGDVGAAVAQTARPAAEPALAEPTALPPAPAPKDPTLAERAAGCQAEPGPLLLAIRERVAELESREAAIAEREGLLTVTEARVRSEIGKLEQAEKALAATLALADGAAERDVAHLVGVYENMKPKEAAQVFGEMDPKFAAGFLARMRADAAAGVLSAMAPPDAYAVTVIMAGRHVGAGIATNAATP